MNRSENRDGISSSESGVTLIELLIVIGIIGILANIAIPAFQQARMQAQVVSTVADFRVVQAAATDHYLRTSGWPPETPAGEIPPELAGAIGDQLNWEVPVLYDWDNLIGPNGLPTQPESGIAIGFSVRSEDPAFLQSIRNAMEGQIGQTWGWGVTFVIEPLAGDTVPTVPPPPSVPTTPGPPPGPGMAPGVPPTPDPPPAPPGKGKASGKSKSQGKNPGN